MTTCRSVVNSPYPCSAGFPLTSICTTATREKQDLVTSCTPWVEVEARLSLVKSYLDWLLDECILPLTRVLTTSIVPGTLSCFPAVTTSHCWPSLPSQSATWIGVRLARKSPESSSTKRHCPFEVCERSDLHISEIAHEAAHRDWHRRESSGGCVIPLLSFFECLLIQGRNCALS